MRTHSVAAQHISHVLIQDWSFLRPSLRFFHTANDRRTAFPSRSPIDSRNARRCCANSVHGLFISLPLSLSLSLSLSVYLSLSLSLFFCAESLSLIPSPLLIPRANEVPHLVTAPIDAILIPAAPTGHLYERGGDEEAEAGERAREAVAVGGGALFAEMRVDAVV